MASLSARQFFALLREAQKEILFSAPFLVNELHRLHDRLGILVGTKKLEGLRTGKFKVYGKSIGKASNVIDKLRRCSRNNFGVYISATAKLTASDRQPPNHQLGGMVRCTENAGREKKSFDKVTFIKVHGEIGKLLRRESCPPARGGTPVYTIGAIIDARIGEKHFE